MENNKLLFTSHEQKISKCQTTILLYKLYWELMLMYKSVFLMFCVVCACVCAQVSPRKWAGSHWHKGGNHSSRRSQSDHLLLHCGRKWTWYVFQIHTYSYHYINNIDYLPQDIFVAKPISILVLVWCWHIGCIEKPGFHWAVQRGVVQITSEDACISTGVCFINSDIIQVVFQAGAQWLRW